MKPLVRKILEAGLVDKHSARMMEKMGLLDAGAEDLAGTKLLTASTLQEFLEDVEELLAPEFRDQETELDKEWDRRRLAAPTDK